MAAKKKKKKKTKKKSGGQRSMKFKAKAPRKSKTARKKKPAKKKPARKTPAKKKPARKTPAKKKAAGAKKPKAAARKSSGGPGTTAERMAKKQRDISVSEFFTKNRHLLGFDSPRKALLTAVKEAVDNSLDACEEARILPELHIQVAKLKRANTYTVMIEDNGPGIVKNQVPNIFGRLLYGSKFHRLRQSRGQQGIGISAAGMYGKLTTGNPARVKTRTSKRGSAWGFEVHIDTKTNTPVFKENQIEWEKDHGTRIEIDLEGEYRRGQRSIEEFIKLCAVTNPHVKITYRDPDNNTAVYEPATKVLPRETDEIKPHPHGVELGLLMRMLGDTGEKWLTTFLQRDFSRVGPKLSQQIVEAAGLSPRSRPRQMDKNKADQLKKAIDETKIMAPPSSCIAPIGEDLIIAGLRKEVDADFYVATSRSPTVYRGNPFLIEVGLAYGRPGDTLELEEDGKIVKKKRKKKPADQTLMGFEGESARLIRYANRVPLLFQQSACAMTRSVIGTNWRSYGLTQPRGGLPVGPLVIMVHIASVWVPFTSESKEAIANYDEIQKQLRLGLQECGRKLGTHIRKGRRLEKEKQKRDYISKYIPIIGEALQEILELSDRQTDRAVDDLSDLLERSRKF